MKKLWIEIIGVSALVLVILFCAAYIYLSYKGGYIVIKQLEDLTGRKVTITYFALTPPLNLSIKDLDIAGLAKAPMLFISPSVLGLLFGNIILNEVTITSPQIVYEKAISNVAQSAPAESTSISIPAADYLRGAKNKKKYFRHFAVKRLSVTDGKVDFIDRGVGENGIKISLRDLSFNMHNLYSFPRSAVTNFDLNAKIPWLHGEAQGKIQVEGWINLVKRDMEATVKIEDIDGLYLYPYYAKWVDLEKSRVEKAKLDFTSNIHGLSNNVTAECHLELKDIEFKPRAPEEGKEKAERIAAALLDIFKALNQGKIVLDFTIKTKMDRPEFGFGSIKMAFQDKLAQRKKEAGIEPQDVMVFPARLLEGLFKGATDLTTSVVVGTINAGKEIGKAVLGPTKKENR